MNSENYYITIPFPIIADKRLNDGDKLVYGEVSGLANREGYCFASNKYIGGVLGKSAMTVRRSIYKLRDLGYITVDLKNSEDENTERKIYLTNAFNLPPMHEMNRGVFKYEQGGSSNMNTIDNNLESKLDILATPRKLKKTQAGNKLTIQLGHAAQPFVERVGVEAGAAGEDQPRSEAEYLSMKVWGVLNVKDESLRRRITHACKGAPRNAVERAMKESVGVEPLEGTMSREEARTRYFFTVLEGGKQ